MGRAMQLAGVVIAFLGAGWFYITAGGHYGYAEFAQLWQAHLRDDTNPKLGLLGVVAGLVVLAVGTMQQREQAAKDAAAAKDLGHE